jgi:hypothetical protein
LTNPKYSGIKSTLPYIGPYADEAPTIARMHAFAMAEGDELRAKHHEIYLSDPRCTAPEKLKTVIRQPIQRQG